MKPLDPNEAAAGDIACLPDKFALNTRWHLCTGCKYEHQPSCPRVPPRDSVHPHPSCFAKYRKDGHTVIYKDR